MNAHTWWTFLVATFIICGSPGPNMLTMMASSARHGIRRTFFTMAGCYCAVMCIIGASVAGLGALLKLEPVIFDILRYAGAAYLVYLGIQAWRAPVVRVNTMETLPPETATSPRQLFGKGFLVGISNPKAILFASAFFQQFINVNAPELPQFVTLVATFSILELGWYVVYATGGSQFSTYLQRENIQKMFNRITGGLFSAFGLIMLCSRV